MLQTIPSASEGPLLASSVTRVSSFELVVLLDAIVAVTSSVTFRSNKRGKSLVAVTSWSVERLFQIHSMWKFCEPNSILGGQILNRRRERGRNLF